MAEYLHLSPHPQWLERDRFITRVRKELLRYGIYNQRIDVIEFVQSLPNVRLMWSDYGSLQVGGQCVKDVKSCGEPIGVITLNSRKSREANQFDCAHELMHFWFHPVTSEMCYMDDDALRIYEIQASWGAREMTMPERRFAQIYHFLHVTRGVAHEHTPAWLASFFGVGVTAARNRLNDLCRRSVIETREVDCKVSGQKGTYVQVRVDENGKATICPRCQNDRFMDGGCYCPGCALPRVNVCSNSECDSDNSPHAAFCEYCASYTVWHEAGVVQPMWESTSTTTDWDGQLEDEVPF